MMFIDARYKGSQNVIFGDERYISKELNTPLLKEDDKDFIEDAYVIYPETIVANPLMAKNVVRYFGNKDGYCNGRSVVIGDNDFIVAHSKVIMPTADFILHNADINPVFNNIDTLPYDQRRIDVTYIGKGYIYGDTAVVPNTLFIAREWPQTQEQLAMVLRQTRFFFTWDAWTATNVEAILCGAVPIILDYGPWKQEEIDGSELGWLPRGDMTDDGIVVDQEKFKIGREDMIKNIGDLSRLWKSKVLEFMGMVQEHFGKN